MESFYERVHRVLDEHREVRLQRLDELLKAHCACNPKHTVEMVVGSIDLCSYARVQRECHDIDAVVFMLDDLHDTLYEGHQKEKVH
jgi:hypothetical protein